MCFSVSYSLQHPLTIQGRTVETTLNYFFLVLHANILHLSDFIIQSCWLLPPQSHGLKEADTVYARGKNASLWVTFLPWQSRADIFFFSILNWEVPLYLITPNRNYSQILGSLNQYSCADKEKVVQDVDLHTLGLCVRLFYHLELRVQSEETWWRNRETVLWSKTSCWLRRRRAGADERADLKCVEPSWEDDWQNKLERQRIKIWWVAMVL